jgi:hypothetical protein
VKVYTAHIRICIVFSDMNTLQLRRAIQCDRDMSRRDIIVASGSGVIVNTDARQFSGKHWLAIWTNVNRTCELFDLLACTPTYYENEVKLISYIRKNYGDIGVYISKRLQHATTAVCG